MSPTDVEEVIEKPLNGPTLTYRRQPPKVVAWIFGLLCDLPAKVERTDRGINVEWPRGFNPTTPSLL